MAQRQRVLILYVSPLFAESLRSLLEREKGLEVATADASTAGRGQRLMGFSPDALILEEGIALTPEERGYVHGHVSTVIHLSLKDRGMRVSHKRQTATADADDLLEAIKMQGFLPEGRKRRRGRGPGPTTPREVAHG